MRTRTSLPIVVATAVMIISSGGAGVRAEAPPLLVGTWHFNPAKSTANADLVPFRRGTCRIETWEDGFKVTYDLVRMRGGITHLEWTGKADGMDYAVQGVEVDVTNAYR